MKRIMVTLLALLLVLGIFGGAPIALAESDREWVDLDISFWHRATDPEIWKTDAVAQHITERFQINFAFPTLDVDLKVAAIAGNLPDIYEVSIGTENFDTFIKEGFAKVIPDEMLAKYPVIEQMIKQNPTAERIKAETGGYFFIPRYYKAESQVMSHGIYYRYDWMTELGIANPPSDMDEMYEMLKAFKEKTGTYGYAGGLWQIHFIPWVDIDNWVVDNDGQLKPGFVSEKVLEGLKWWNRLYQEGIMASNYDEINSREELIAGNTGIYYGNSGQLWNYRIVVEGFETQDTQWRGAGTDAIKILEPPMGPDGERHWPIRPKEYTLMFNNEMSDAELDRALEFLEWIMTEEGGNLFAYGFEGKDYLIQDGKVVTIRPKNQNTMLEMQTYEIYPCVNLGLIVASDGNPFITPTLYSTFPDRILAMDAQYWADYSPAAVDYNIEINNYSTALYNDFLALGFDYEAALNQLVKSNNLEVDFENYVRDVLEAKGLGAVIDEFNAKFN